jgi:hypothetical protein
MAAARRDERKICQGVVADLRIATKFNSRLVKQRAEDISEAESKLLDRLESRTTSQCQGVCIGGRQEAHAAEERIASFRNGGSFELDVA